MGTLQADCEEKQEMDDSGCIQDETPPGKRCANGIQGVQLLDLSDDVLLMILKYLAPRDLKALGYTCPRLGALILDRSLWQTVDARGQPWGRARFRWYLARALHAGTRELLVSGHAREARECLGVAQTREEMEAAKEREDKANRREEDNNNQPGDRDTFTPQRVIEVPALGPNAQLYIDDQRREPPESAWPRTSDPLVPDSGCPGPQFTLAQNTLRQLTYTCPALSSLALDYCNINCNCTNIGMFPATLRKLSLRGSKCYNLPMDRSFLFKIQDSLPDLESLDVSECDWMEPATLLPLSKLPALKHLYAQDCLRLTEFVAYASLATRYGFTKLQSLDLRGSPVGDSEVSALGWLGQLSRLWLAPARAAPPTQRAGDKAAPAEPDDWEEQEPEYYKIKEPDNDEEESPERSAEENKHTWQAKVNGNASEFNSIPTVLSSSTITSPNRIFHAFPLRPGIRSRASNSNPGASSPAMCNASPMPGSSDDRAPNSSSPAKVHASPMCPDIPNDGSRPALNPTRINNGPPMFAVGDALFMPGSFNESQSASNSSSPTMAIHASPMRPGSSNDNQRAADSTSGSSSSNDTRANSTSSLSMSPNISITRSNASPSKCCNIITPSSVLKAKRSKYNESKASKRKTTSPTPGPSKRKRDFSSSSEDDDDNVPLKCLIKPNVNEGASTSKEEKEEEAEPEAEENEQEEEEAQPRHHVLYVNVGQRLHAVYRLSLDNEHVVSFNRNQNRIDPRNLFVSPPGSHLDASSLVTDSAIRRFGRADGEDINYVHIGPNGPYPAAQGPGARPDRSPLTHLSVTGFRTITNRSLEHLATSAPLLQFLDLSETNVTDSGVAAFRSLRPDCEVVYSKYEKKD